MKTVRTALVFAAVALIGGCTAEPVTRTGIDGIDFTEPPLPAQAATIATDANVSPEPEPDCGDPTASLRPDNAADGPTLDAIRARGRLVVGLDAGSNLFSFRDPISGAIVGFDADIAREVARDLLGSPDLIEYRSLSSADREKALQEHSVDLVVKTMTVTCDRRQRVSFSTVYLLAHQRVLAVKGSGIESLADLAGRRVCVVAGTTSVDHIRRYEPKATILTVPTWADCLVVLQQRQVDAVSTDDSILAGLAAQDPYTHIVGPSISDEPYGIGISKGNDDLVRFVNKTLARIRADGTWTRIYDRWLSVLGETPRPPEPVYQD
ncbi:glutamate ABC transporter substrate-binding protein [Nocardia cyriacigeorgica]|uniref:glutamate ABC transporter substrate-binding protein n=1 Tax=Nocardia cyriacigeorgica TaxID=135487 RepID=UPI0018931E24|nr:glutamate ABC transporter substrate-binding protein [Nocardia cyriacigeorgica]MBF6437448.1 glutamate ABC transporter substrate-binding protein [Nocardia cyriacigeorgica]MBF6453017.1 glutamate ABC transporter substrate-binding protein [Nocardia cyriacigeorgica]MBF6478440.1 glutamate ABC transporter substrate-binding protein [Nocardia cyriacigeorgica]MBF6550186.1 glutamate ABC transporter substrate-binding protein [Nocardia cyriacigeorgica]